MNISWVCRWIKLGWVRRWIFWLVGIFQTKKEKLNKFEIEIFWIQGLRQEARRREETACTFTGDLHRPRATNSMRMLTFANFAWSLIFPAKTRNNFCKLLLVLVMLVLPSPCQDGTAAQTSCPSPTTQLSVLFHASFDSNHIPRLSHHQTLVSPKSSCYLLACNWGRVHMHT